MVTRRWEREAAAPAHDSTSTLADSIAWLLTDRARRGRAAGTLEMYGQKAKVLARVLGGATPLALLDAARIDRFVETREREGVSQSTIHKELVTLRGCLKLARRRNAFAHDPSAILPVGFSPRYTPRTSYLPLEEWERFVDAFPARRGAMIAWMLATGANFSEAARARLEHVDQVEKTIFLDGRKTRYRARTIPITPVSAPFIERALRDAPGTASGLLFKPWANVWRDVRDACIAAGLAHYATASGEKLPAGLSKSDRPAGSKLVGALSSNDLRRSFCSMLVSFNVPFDLCARLMGHGSADMVSKVYAQIRPAGLSVLVNQYFRRPGEIAAMLAAANASDVERDSSAPGAASPAATPGNSAGNRVETETCAISQTGPLGRSAQASAAAGATACAGDFGPRCEGENYACRSLPRAFGGFCDEVSGPHGARTRDRRIKRTSVVSSACRLTPDDSEPPPSAGTAPRSRALRAYFADALDAARSGDRDAIDRAMRALAERAPRSPFVDLPDDDDEAPR